ncbi:hypothetical protein RJ641_014503 [Dillenia turbinata]|uniref:Uncharacterized protein n=1 Tax=Dillenia turbinata TaxID=194707 RepID=A0AAN8US96_9MAGN
MTLLELVTRASATPQTLTPHSYPITLNPDDSLLSLKPESDDIDSTSLVTKVGEFKLSSIDTEIIALSSKFFGKLKKKVKNPNFDKDEFFELLTSFLAKIGGKVGVSLEKCENENGSGYTSQLVEKLGFCIGKDVLGLVLDACVELEIWGLLKTVIVNKLVDYAYVSKLLASLVEKKRSDLICLCVKHFSDIRASDIYMILGYFLSPPKGAFSTMNVVREEWEKQGLLATEKVSSGSVKGKKFQLAKDASILLMMAHDGFTVSELCLHYLIASPNFDEVVWSAPISRLNGKQMMSLIKYLGKWLNKFERFPEASPCLRASKTLGSEACDWVPSLERIVNCLGLVLDEHFPSMVLHPEFRDQLLSVEPVVGSLALEARLCCSINNLLENLQTDGKGS